MQKTAVIDRRYSCDRIYEMASTLFWNSDILIGEEERWNWRKGWFMRPFCHLTIRVTRVVSHPPQLTGVFAQRLRLARTKRGMTQTEFATAIGVNIRSLKNWETGRNVPRKQQLERMPDYLKTDTPLEYVR